MRRSEVRRGWRWSKSVTKSRHTAYDTAFVLCAKPQTLSLSPCLSSPHRAIPESGRVPILFEMGGPQGRLLLQTQRLRPTSALSRRLVRRLYKSHLSGASAVVHTMGILLEADYKGVVQGKEPIVSGLQRAFSSSKLGSQDPMTRKEGEALEPKERDGQLTYELMNRDSGMSTSSKLWDWWRS